MAPLRRRVSLALSAELTVQDRDWRGLTESVLRGRDLTVRRREPVARRGRTSINAPRWRGTPRRAARHPPTPVLRRTRGRTPAVPSPDRGPATSPSQTPWCRCRASASRRCAWCRVTGSPARPLPCSGGGMPWSRFRAESGEPSSLMAISPVSIHVGPSVSFSRFCCAFSVRNAAMTSVGIGKVRRERSDFGAPVVVPAPRTITRPWATLTVPASKSTADHARPSTSERRQPASVSSQHAYSFAGRSGSRVIAEQSNSAHVRLGVKWSRFNSCQPDTGQKPFSD